MNGKGRNKYRSAHSYLKRNYESITNEKKRKNIIEILEQEHEVDLVATKEGEIMLHVTIEKMEFSRKDIIDISDICFDCCDRVEGIDKRVKFLLMAIDNRTRKVVNLLMKHKVKIHQKSDLIIHYLLKDEHEKLCTYQLNDIQLRMCDVEVMEQESSILINWLISQGFNFSYKNQVEQSAVESAISYNLLHLLPNLLMQIHHTHEHNIELLHLFLKRNNKGPIYPDYIDKKYASDILKIFLDKRQVAFDAVGSSGQTALDLAIAAKEDFDFIKILLSGQRANNDNIFIDRAFIKAIEVLTSFNDYFEATYYMQILVALKDKGADVNCTNEGGMTPIHLAVARKNVRAIKFLVDNGADPKVTTKDGHNLLHLLAAKSRKYTPRQQSYADLFDFLMTSGVDQLEAANNLGDSPLHVAASNGNLAIVRKLIKLGANVDCRNNLSKETPLHWAVGNHEAVDVVKYLLKRGANVNSKDGVSGRRALSWAAENPRNDQMFEVLLRGGAHVNARDRNGQTALYALLKNATSSPNDAAKVQDFLERGADINEKSVVSLVSCPLEQLFMAPSVTAALATHSMKLKAAGLPYSEAYDHSFIIAGPHCEFFHQCLKEVEKLKITCIEACTSLYRWLHMDPNRRCTFANNNDTLKGIVKSPTLAKQFPSYEFVILGIYREAAARKPLLQAAVQAWYELTNVDLVDECVELILSYLSNADLLDIIEDD